MDRIEIRAERAHAFEGDEARRRLVALVEALRGKYASYGLEHEWADEARRAIRFRFGKEGRGSGEGTASLAAGEVKVEIRALFKLPFFLPVRAAEWKFRDELVRALEEAFA